MRRAALMKPLLVGMVLVLGWIHTARADPGSREDRAALFDYILKATLERSAFEPKKPADIGVAWGAGASVTMAEFVRRQMLLFRAEMLAANTDEKLYYVLTKISNTRFDHHIRGVSLVEGGLAPKSVIGARKTHAPIKFRPDYGDRATMFFFVSDFAVDIQKYGPRPPEVGDKLVAVNGKPIGVYVEEARRYIGRSSHRAVWWWMATSLPEKDLRHAPSSFYGARLELELESRKGSRYRVRLPYLDYDAIAWAGHDDVVGDAHARRQKIESDPSFMSKSLQGRISLARYHGFERRFSRPAFDVYESTAKRAFVLEGHGFYTATLTADLEVLLEYARKNGLLDYAIIYDLTRGAGGDLEEYTLQRLQPRPFKIIFGNLRISDVTPALTADLRREALEGIAQAGKRRAPVVAQQVAAQDSGAYLLEWLDIHVGRAIRERQAYSSGVQFKSQFLPVSTDGYLYPAKQHFSGPMVLFTSPQACSGADQFASMFIDNNLGLSVGMPQGGCSNTWEWEEVLKFPSGKPVVQFMWTVGHSIRPNGEVLEGNSAEPRISVPLTRENHRAYHDLLMGHALEYIDAQRRSGRREPTMFDHVTNQAFSDEPAP